MSGFTGAVHRLHGALFTLKPSESCLPGFPQRFPLPPINKSVYLCFPWKNKANVPGPEWLPITGPT